MAIVAGIDEAGYGPLLGPLVVTGVVLDVPDQDAHGCLWEKLAGSSTRRNSKSDHRLVIADSKKLHQGKYGFRRLERTATVTLASAGFPITTFRSTLDALCPEAAGATDQYPWYRDFDIPLPIQNDPTQIQLVANAFQKDLRDQEIQLLGIFCEPLLEGHFNRLVANTRNKAVVSFGLVLRIIDRIAAAAGSQSCTICIDRQGGRTHYGPPLMTALDLRHINILQESEEASIYQIERNRTTMELAFRTYGEENSLPCALASVISKYMREVFMVAFNRYWGEASPGVKPTAGYYQDGRRFLSEIDPVIASRGIDRTMLVRRQ